ncbi:hypothetical protein AB6A40_002737 [Gnathostoma spinigerum]|uniref:Uncharacterized protein n=1 Tax=Gnathostoma spinigerum TaxID=75299 RepID=A0ABD6E7G0_9BILA
MLVLLIFTAFFNIHNFVEGTECTNCASKVRRLRSADTQYAANDYGSSDFYSETAVPDTYNSRPQHLPIPYGSSSQNGFSSQSMPSYGTPTSYSLPSPNPYELLFGSVPGSNYQHLSSYIMPSSYGLQSQSGYGISSGAYPYYPTTAGGGSTNYGSSSSGCPTRTCGNTAANSNSYISGGITLPSWYKDLFGSTAGFGTSSPHTSMVSGSGAIQPYSSYGTFSPYSPISSQVPGYASNSYWG